MGKFFTLFFIIFFGINNITWGQVEIIAQQDFESIPATSTLTYTNIGSGGIVSGTYTAGRPNPTNKYASGSSCWELNNGTSALTFNSVNTASYKNISLSFHIASYSTTTGNGADGTDSIYVSISPDNGATWYRQILMRGGTNTYWAFYGGTTRLARTYSTGAELASTANVDSIVISGLPSVANLRVRINLRNNAAEEKWLIDNIILKGEPDVTSITASPHITGLNYYLGAGPSAAQSFNVSAAKLTPAADSITITAPTNFKIATTSGGTYVDVIKLPYTDSTLATVAIWTRLAAGLGVGSYSDSITLSGGGAPVKKIGVSGSVYEPTITVSPTSITGLNYVAGLGASLPQSFTVSGSTLTPTSGTLNVSAPTNFLVSLTENGTYTSSVNINYTSGTLASSTVYVVLQGGLSTGNYADSITVSGGGAASKKTGVAGSVVPNNCAELFISEYVEGNSNNKFVEIYNPTPNPIILCSSGGVSYYKFCTYTNGSSTATNLKFTNGATVPAYGTYILKNTSASTTVYSGTAQTSINFDGNDALSLEKFVYPTTTLTNASNIVDVIGSIGDNTSWTAGSVSTTNQTLVRHPSVTRGVTINPGSGFPTLATEWISYPIDEGHFLGSHISTCQNNNYTIASVSGISPTQYCPGQSISIPFEAYGTYPSGNVFTAQLSSSTASFASPVNIGILSLNGTNLTGTINATIPTSATAGTEYHIRITSSSPAAGMLANGQHITILASTPPVVTAPAATQENNATTLSWTNPSSGCWEEIMAVISTTPAFTFTPTGNGSAYTANPVYASGNQVIYKGTGNSVNISGLNNGTVYYIKIFTRNGTTWSSAVEHEILVDPYCYPKYTYPPISPSIGSCDEYISRVELGTINNSSPEGCGYNGYSWYANQSTTLVKGQSYQLTVQMGIVGATNDESYAGDDLRVWIDWNGDGTFNNTNERIINNLNNAAAGTYTITVPTTAITSAVRMRVQVIYYETTDPTSACGKTYRDGETEDYTVNLIEPCTTILSPFSFYPREGSAGTEVRIVRQSGAGNFTQVDSVMFNGVKATSFRIVDDYTIFAIVPEGAGTGRVTLFDNTPCSRNSGVDFTYLNKSGVCNVYNDLFISEVYDTVGNTHYIELFNGTNSAINLSTPNNYTLRILNKNDYSHANPVTNTINITGVIPAGETRVYYAGATGPKVTGTQTSAGAGFNAYDDVILAKNGTAIDVFRAPTTVHFNYRRLNTATIPSSTYISTDWTSHAVTSSNIGIYVPLEPFKITTHPINVSGCTIDMQVAATGSGLSYKWYYNDNKTNDLVWKAVDSLILYYPFTVSSGINTNHLLVTGDLGELNNFQFYCVVTNGSCSEYSDVARFQLAPDPYFRSKQNGDWRLSASWEMSPDGVNWTDACTFPWDTNSVSVIILNGDSIYVTNVTDNPDVQIDQLRIELGGFLQVASDAKLHINDSTGIDLMVEGVLVDHGVATGSNGVTFLNNARWILGDGGTIIKTSSTSVLSYKDHYYNGIDQIPATAHWIFRKVSGINPVMVTNGMYYPNLYFEDVNAGNAIYTFSGNSDFATVKGSLYVGYTGLTVVVNNYNTYSTPLRVLGGVYVGNPSVFRIGDAAVTPGTGIEVGGDIVNNGTFDINHSSSGLLRLNGTGTQSISGTGTFDIWNMHVNKPSQSLVNLNRDIEVKNQLAFSGGIIQTNAYTLNVSNGDPVNAITGFDTPNGTGVYNDDNYVIGQLRRTINSASSIYAFPVGDVVAGLGYNPTRLVIRSLPGGTPFATGRFVASWPGTINTRRHIDCSGSMKLIEYTGLTNEGYWRFDGSTFNNYDIYIHPNLKNNNTMPNEHTNLGHANNYRALKEINTQAGNVWDPAVSVGGNPCIVSNNYYEIIGAGYSGFSIFAPGGGNGNTTALPIELLYFNIACIQPEPIIQWATASELNTAYFTIEGSDNGIHYSPIVHIDAAGNSSKKIEYAYSIRDENRSNYYRLVETDLDGNVYYHGIISNDCKVNGDDKNKIFYQPGNGIVAQFGHNRIPVAVQVYDAIGRLMSSDKIGQHQNAHIIHNATRWAQGVYFVTLFYSDNDIETEKVVVH